ncbi:helix-turn-helix transcriptional regulator [Methylobacterium radiotolerans]|uniref:helix-turn-helix transcriptional regulator n=1 Tax=Methylobacterium radiotolerans TaxID=31998 RepID=UPI001F453CFB|nr:helix-turn-helix domain-containing protein [Methylobacterium radiotolerans]UIY40823.1 helix-turn-helix domain-containing protein [Methylobacterium radiotolerans]
MQAMTRGEVRAPHIIRPKSIVLNFRAACEAASLSVSTMRRLIAAGRGPQVIKLSDRRIGIRRSDLEAWLADRATYKY